MLQITMLMFSGRPDPTWTIDGAEEQELRRLIAAGAADTAMPIIPYHLGYRGFRVVDLAAPLQPLVRVQSLGRSIPSFNFIGAPEIEDFLLRTGRARIPGPLHTRRAHGPDQPDDIASASLEALPDTLPRPFLESRLIAPHVACPPSRAVQAPPYEPQTWAENDGNCYNYAVNGRTGGGQLGLTGRKSRNIPPMWTGSGCLFGSIEDGLVRIVDDNVNAIISTGHYCCLVVTSGGRDFHWYRQDSNGCWSHKPGSTSVTNLDQSGAEIADPRSCNRGPYPLIVAFLICPQGLNIE